MLGVRIGIGMINTAKPRAGNTTSSEVMQMIALMTVGGPDDWTDVSWSERHTDQD